MTVKKRRAGRFQKKRKRKIISDNKSRFKQGYYRPVNVEKYIPTPNKMSEFLPFYRSSWELKFMKYLDKSDDVLRWSSEPFPVEYFSSDDGRVRHYYPDFYVEFANGKRLIVEIKPASQTNLKRNLEKWDAVQNLCYIKNLDFAVLTEKELGV